MLASTPTGFKDAPISKLICVGTAVLPIAASLLNVQYLFTLRINPHLTIWHQWYRLILNSTVFTDQIRAFIAAELFYECRAVERMIGSKKFSKIVLGSLAVTSIATPLAMLLIDSLWAHMQATSGSTAVLSALIACYMDLIPPVFCYSLKGVGHFTDKSLLLLLAPNLLFAPGNLLKSALGYVTGVLFLNWLK